MAKRARAQPKVIFIEGIHGVGKSSVFHGLKRLYSPNNFKFYPERLLMKPLFPFGSSDIQIAFRSELHFLQQMIERNKRIGTELAKKKKPMVCVLDRSALSVIVYSKSLGIKGKDLQVILDLFRSVNWYENVMIYLYAKPETLLSRITKRGSLEPDRLQWNEDDINYIKKLEKHYSIQIKKMENKIQIINIDTEGFNLEEVISMARTEIDKLLPKQIPPPGQKVLDSWLSLENP
ncbi:MAG: deoxynucleoside kinase [Candidatus Lokiarchaeota archaeon]|nr:deoxynucleoside kinase [Candidatus Lokiarchaeota archaeon]